MGENFLKDCRYIFWVEIQLGERAHLGQSLDVSFETGGLYQTGFRWDDKYLDLAKEGTPVEGEVFVRS